MIMNAPALLQRLRAIHERIRGEVLRTCRNSDIVDLAAVVGESAGDTIFALDRVSERALLALFAEMAEEWPCVLVAEGLDERGGVPLPAGRDPDQAALRIIVDPIDGTRPLMYQKRSAWILTGVAPNRGAATTLADIELALQTEIPTLKQDRCDTLWAIAGGGVGGERVDLQSGARTPLRPSPSRATTIAQGFGGIARFFPGTIAELAAIEDEVIERTLGPPIPGKARAFNDQYTATGGQLYELLMGHDRWIADLRPLLEEQLRPRGRALGICCHPYDICTELIAREAGLPITDEHGQPLSAPLDVRTEVCWIGYANDAIRAQVEPVLRAVLRERGLLGA